VYKNVATMFDEVSGVPIARLAGYLGDRNNQSGIINDQININVLLCATSRRHETRSRTYRVDCVEIVRKLQNRGKFLLPLSPFPPNPPLSHLIVGGSNTRSFRVGGSTRATKLAMRAAAADSISPVENFHGEITMSTTSFLRE